MLKREMTRPDDIVVLGASTEHTQLLLDCPELIQFLGSTTWPEDGAPRITGTLLICTGDGRFRACLNDRAQSRTAWVSDPTLQGTLEACEHVLESGGGEWRKSTPTNKRK